MSAWHIILRDLKNWLRRKRVFAVDIDAYETLRQVARRERSSPEEVASRLIRQAADQHDMYSRAARCWEQLSPRQKQITAHICRGDVTAQIAQELNISPTTVKSHVEVVLIKFDVNNRLELRQALSFWDLSDYL